MPGTAPIADPANRKRSVHRLVACLVALVVVALGLSFGAAAEARKTYTRTASARQRAHVVVTERSTVRITVWYPARGRSHAQSAFATVTGAASAGGTVTRGASRRATATTASRARALALSRARSAARSAAKKAARSIAVSRARSAAHASAVRQATATALTRAKARYLTASAASIPPVTAPAPGPTTTTIVPDPTTPDEQPTTPEAGTSGPETTTGVPAPTATPGPACGGEAPLPATMTCTFDDEFTGPTLDTTKWSAVTTAGSSFQGGPECYVDTPDNISVSAGMLDLTARQESAPFLCHDKLHGDHLTEYSAGSVSSIGKFSQAYGQFSVRARFPAAKVAGLQASLWMWPANQAKYHLLWPLSGELDIAEQYSIYNNLAIPYLHYGLDATTYDKTTGTNVPTGYSCSITPGAFHEYTANWSPGTITISVDGRLCLTDHYVGVDALGALLPPAAPFDQPFFMILTQGLGVPTPNNTSQPDNRFMPGTTPLPATTSIDYVRVWQYQ